MKERGLARITLLNCRRIYSHIQYDIPSDFYNLSRKTGQVQSITLPRHAFIVLSLLSGETIALIPKHLYSHKHFDRVIEPWDWCKATEDTDEETSPLLKESTGQKCQAEDFSIQYLPLAHFLAHWGWVFSLVGRWGMDGWLALPVFSSWDLYSPWYWRCMSFFHQWLGMLDYFMDKLDDFLKCREAMQESQVWTPFVYITL